MKLFKTNDLQTIMDCQSYFDFQLHSVRLSERSKAFALCEIKLYIFRYLLFSVLTCIHVVHCSLLAAVLLIMHLICELLCFCLFDSTTLVNKMN